MNKVVSVCAGIALVASIIAVHLRAELRKEREVAAASQRQTTEVLPPVSHPAAPPPDTTLSPNMAAATAADTPIREQLKDPESRKLQLARLRTTIERSYPGLAQELRLSEDEADRLFDLLAGNQLAGAADGSLLTALGDLGNQQEALQRREAFDRAQEESIQALLGGNYAQWQAYQQTLPARLQVTVMTTQLAQTGKALTAAQKSAVTTALIAERQRQVEEERFISRPPPGDPAAPGYRTLMMEESMKRAEENNRRNLEAAAPYIDATQLAVLREEMDRLTSMNRQLLHTQRESERRPAQLPQ